MTTPDSSSNADENYECAADRTCRANQPTSATRNTVYPAVAATLSEDAMTLWRLLERVAAQTQGKRSGGTVPTLPAREAKDLLAKYGVQDENP